MKSVSRSTFISHLSLLVVRSGHWCQENRACQWGLAPPVVPGDRTDLALQEVLVLFGLMQRTEQGSGSIWSCSETSGLQRRSRVVEMEKAFQPQEKHRRAPEQVCGDNSLLTLDKLFTHLPCDGAHGSLGLHITLKKWGFKSLRLDNQTVDL